MTTLQDLINLAKADGGKFFVIDETGDPKLVIMPVEEYQRLLLGKLQKQVMDVEKINREILKAQLQDEIKTNTAQPAPARTDFSPVYGPTVITDPLDQARQHHRSVDLRSEVIDPSFDFEGPKIDIDDL